MRRPHSGYHYGPTGIDLQQHPECQDLPLVAKIVHDLVRLLPGGLRGLEVEDLLQAGYLVLRRCHQCYDPAQGARSTYIASALRKVLGILLNRSRSPLSLSHYNVQLAVQVCLGGAGAAEGISTEQQHRAWQAWQALHMTQHLQTDLPAQKPTAADWLGDGRADLDHCLGLLSPLERWVLVEHYGLEGRPPRTFADIGRDWPQRPVTRAWVERVHRLALRALRGFLE